MTNGVFDLFDLLDDQPTLDSKKAKVEEKPAPAPVVKPETQQEPKASEPTVKEETKADSDLSEYFAEESVDESSNEEITESDITAVQEELLPVDETPSVEEPVVEEPTKEEPIVEAPAVEEPAETDVREEADKQEQEETEAIAAAKAKRGAASTSTKPASKTSKSSSKKKEDEKDKFEVNLDTTIKYDGMAIPLTDYFTDDEITKGIATTDTKGKITHKKITGEDVRNRMENSTEEDRGFPELVASYTEMVYIKDKNMIRPIPTARKKGIK